MLMVTTKKNITKTYLLGITEEQFIKIINLHTAVPSVATITDDCGGEVFFPIMITWTSSIEETEDNQLVDCNINISETT